MRTNLQTVSGHFGSLQAIVNAMEINILTTNETNLKGRSKLNQEDYKSFTRNRNSNVMGGVSTTIKDDGSNTALKISDGNNVKYMGSFNLLSMC